jgi:hypothetical protein
MDLGFSLHPLCNLLIERTTLLCSPFRFQNDGLRPHSAPFCWLRDKGTTCQHCGRLRLELPRFLVGLLLRALLLLQLALGVNDTL